VALLETTSTPVMLRIVWLARVTAFRTASLKEVGELPTSSRTLTIAPSCSCPGMPYLPSVGADVRESATPDRRAQIGGRSEQVRVEVGGAQPCHTRHAGARVDGHR